MKKIDAVYNPHDVEQRQYKKWLDANAFKAGAKDKKPFSLILPPPNVTAKLHLGHAMNATIQDLIARFKRMQGYDVLLLPGVDHA